MVVETVLIMVALLGFALLVSNVFRGEELFAQVISAPWRRLDGMIQHGSWAPAEEAMLIHPNQQSIHITKVPK